MSLLQNFAFIFAALGASYGIGKALDDVSRKEVKQSVASWLTETDLASNYSNHLHASLVGLFNDLFTDNCVTFKFARRSAALSIIGFLICAISAFWWHSLDTKFFPGLDKLTSNPKVLATAAAIGLICAAMSDYLSLAKSSLIFNSNHFQKNPLRFYALDVILSFFLAINFIISSAGFIGLLANGNFTNSSLLIVFALATSMFPTIFALLLVLGGFLAKFAYATGQPLQLLKIRILNVDEKPFSSAAILLWPVILFFSGAIICVVG